MTHDTTREDTPPSPAAPDAPKTPLPSIVLVGRPNVGKSTLFNRLIGANRAITHDRPGITRDRMEGTVRRPPSPPFGIVDTGGLTLESRDSPRQTSPGLDEDILAQTRTALAGACAAALVVDARDGLLPLDEGLAGLLRRTGLPTCCIVNKVDGPEREEELLAPFHGLGLPLVAVSAEHGHHINLLVERLVALLPEGEPGALPDPPHLKLTLLGRPNAGKSSLLNALAGEDRMIVSSVAGTTRDSVDVRFTRDGRDYVFVDTAGIRKRTKITDAVERYSVTSALKSASKSQVTLVTLDATEGVSQQDKRLMDLLDDRKLPFVVLLNKCDLIPRERLTALVREAREMLPFCSHVPLLAVSALSGKNLGKILPLARRLHEECSLRISTGRLNRAMEEVLAAHQPPLVNRRRAKFFYLTQAESSPPTFVFFVNDPSLVPEHYMRYLERHLRKMFDIEHAPMRLRLRSSHTKAPRA
ncbi:MAG: ribosome biogenesis GTPase Der [Desulfovibrio sp.]|jgi:GTP-binding protein|nr:ribosome biogenesis GTPase Der [Desulfovibrio sp.]